MNTGVIVVKNSDGKIPEEFVNIASTQCDGSFGFAMSKPDGGLFHYSQKASPEEATEITKETQNDAQCADKTAVFFYGKAEDKIHTDDHQPHVVLRDSSNQPLMAVFLEGKFEEEFEKLSENSPQHHTPAFFVAQTYLVGKISKLFQQNKYNLVETVKDLQQPDTYKEISARVRADKTNRFQITFVPAIGTPFSIKQGASEKSFPWGDISQAFGYDEKSTTKPTVSSKSVFGSPSPAAPTVPLQPTVSPLPDNIPDGSKPSVPSVPQKDNDLTKYADMLFVPPGHIKNRSSRKDWYKLYGYPGILNEISKNENKAKGDWTQGQAPIKLTHSHLKNAEALLRDNKIARWSDEARPVAEVKPITSDAPAVISDAKVTETKAPSIMMIVPPSDRQKIEVLLPRVISSRDEKGQLIIDPAKLNEYEKSVPTLAEQLGKPAGTFLPIDPEGYDLIEQVNPGATKRLFFENQGIMVHLQKKVEELEKKAEPKSKSAFAA